jgi:lipoyl(octanoyl) transferase
LPIAVLNVGGESFVKPQSPESPPMEVFLLGLVDFEDVLSLQRRLVYDLGERSGGSLILCEHPPTISVGRNGSRAHILADDEQLRSAGIRVRWVNRGGGCILHLPGQLSAYLAVPLDPAGLTLQTHLDRLHRVVLETLLEFDLRGSTRPDHPGIFLGAARVASIGVAVNRWIAYHGFTLNVGPYLDLFDLIDEPGPGDGRLRQTSLESRRQRTTPMPKVREALIRRIEQEFNFSRHHIYTHHPLIRRKVVSHAYAPSPG